jgi:hypothetical protein
MKSKITKQVKAELKQILDNTGYWSNETRNYIEQFDYTTKMKLHSMAQVYDKYRYGL